LYDGLVKPRSALSCRPNGIKRNAGDDRVDHQMPAEQITTVVVCVSFAVD
jgi:hypothetical protein